MATLNVGAGQTYATVSAAVNAARDGDTVAVRAGTYVNDFATINKDIQMRRTFISLVINCENSFCRARATASRWKSALISQGDWWRPTRALTF